LLYAETHEWTAVSEEDGGKVATIGISNFAVEALSDLVFIQLPEVGKKLAAGETFGEIESVKAVSDLNCPVAGEVVEVNSNIEDHLEILATDPWNSGWMLRIKPSSKSLEGLMDAEAYEKHLAAAH
jgi:glycine cleavage system H protein